MVRNLVGRAGYWIPVGSLRFAKNCQEALFCRVNLVEQVSKKSHIKLRASDPYRKTDTGRLALVC